MGHYQYLANSDGPIIWLFANIGGCAIGYLLMVGGPSCPQNNPDNLAVDGLLARLGTQITTKTAQMGSFSLMGQYFWHSFVIILVPYSVTISICIW